jgi:coproporphyrinogen III oxidase
LGSPDDWAAAGNNSGDFKFAATFGDVLADPGIPAAHYNYNNKTTYNPEHNINSWFQVWPELTPYILR